MGSVVWVTQVCDTLRGSVVFCKIFQRFLNSTQSFSRLLEGVGINIKFIAFELLAEGARIKLLNFSVAVEVASRGRRGSRRHPRGDVAEPAHLRL